MQNHGQLSIFGSKPPYVLNRDAELRRKSSCNRIKKNKNIKEKGNRGRSFSLLVAATTKSWLLVSDTRAKWAATAFFYGAAASAFAFFSPRLFIHLGFYLFYIYTKRILTFSQGYIIFINMVLTLVRTIHDICKKLLISLMDKNSVNKQRVWSSNSLSCLYYILFMSRINWVICPFHTY